MDISKARNDAVAARNELERGDTRRARLLIDRVVGELSETLLTTNEAKEALGIRSVNTLKALVRKAELRTEMHGNRMMIPRSELERLHASELMRGIRASDRLHDASADLGTSDGLTQEELDSLSEGRPGEVAWNARRPAAV